jgi:hypothetical protein
MNLIHEAPTTVDQVRTNIISLLKQDGFPTAEFGTNRINDCELKIGACEVWGVSVRHQRSGDTWRSTKKAEMIVVVSNGSGRGRPAMFPQRKDKSFSWADMVKAIKELIAKRLADHAEHLTKVDNRSESDLLKQMLGDSFDQTVISISPSTDKERAITLRIDFRSTMTVNEAGALVRDLLALGVGAKKEGAE